MDIKAYKKAYFDEKITSAVNELEGLINDMDFADPAIQESIACISKDKIVIRVSPTKLKDKYNYDFISNINAYLSERKAASSGAILTNLDINICDDKRLSLTYDISNL